MMDILNMQQNKDIYSEHPYPAFWVLLFIIVTVLGSFYLPNFFFFLDAPQTKLQTSVYLYTSPHVLKYAYQSEFTVL